MASRNLTSKFVRLRDEFQSAPSSAASSESGRDVSLKTSFLQPSSEHENNSNHFSIHVEPAWKTKYDEISDILKSLRVLVNEIRVLREKVCRVSHDADDQKQQISQMQQLNMYSHKVAETIKIIQTKLTNESKCEGAEQMVIKNLNRKYTSELQSLITQFRTDSVTYNDYVKTFIAHDDPLPAPTVVYDDSQLQTNLHAEQDAMQLQHEKEFKQIQQIAQDVYQINDLFQELSGLLLVQGEQLNRIEANMYEASNHMQHAVEDHLIPAEKSSRQPAACACFVMLLVLNIVLLALVIYKENK